MPQVGKNVPPLNRARDVLLCSKRGWPNVLEEMAEVWPDTPTVMWQQEHLAKATAEICGAISGLDADQFIVPDGKINARKDETPRPAVFSPDENMHLSRRYKRHVRRMKRDGDAQWAGGPV